MTNQSYGTRDEYLREFSGDSVHDDSDIRIPRALDRASRLVDTYVRSTGIQVPLTDPATLRDVRGSVLDLARYFAWPDQPSEEVRARYEDAIKFLELVSTGKIKLVVAGQEVVKSGFTNIRLFRA
ncbi:phage protein Gp36 family protein [Pseudomonas asiatica]|uniref:phage protein Gp36 family protein n=1 Tax=Pseudomonas asiatica TaxID=2219225 RepID=UPI0010BFD605|nr:phage protein Gp36 family protein [Pseudomonas asiatica]